MFHLRRPPRRRPDCPTTPDSLPPPRVSVLGLALSSSVSGRDLRVLFGPFVPTSHVPSIMKVFEEGARALAGAVEAPPAS